MIFHYAISVTAVSNNGISKYIVIIVSKTLPCLDMRKNWIQLGSAYKLQLYGISGYAQQNQRGQWFKNRNMLVVQEHSLSSSLDSPTSTTKNKRSSVSVLSKPPPTPAHHPHPSTPLLPRNSTSWTHCPLPLHPEGFDQVPETPKYTPAFPLADTLDLP